MHRRKIRFIVFFGQALLISGLLLATPQMSYGQGGGAGQTQNVNVVNTASNPVPTTLQGTATVNVGNTPTVSFSPTANIVQSQQSGIWNVGIAGTPTFGLSTSANTVQSLQSGPWSVGILGTPTVNLASGNSINIAGTPIFKISSSDNTVQAQQSGIWNVGISGTPTVNLASGSSVSVTGTPNVSLVPGTSVQISNTTANPIPVQNVGGTSLSTSLLFNSGTVSIPNAPGTTNLGDFDASAFSKIRVVAGSNCTNTSINQEDLKVFVVSVEGGQPVQIIEELQPCVITPFRISKIIDLPGATLRITVFHNFTHDVAQNIQVVVYGR